MIKKSDEKGRLSIDVGLEEHKQIKILAAMKGKSIRDFVLETIRERLKSESQNWETYDKNLGALLPSESALKKDWLKPEEDEAWKDL